MVLLHEVVKRGGGYTHIIRIKMQSHETFISKIKKLFFGPEKDFPFINHVCRLFRKVSTGSSEHADAFPGLAWHNVFCEKSSHCAILPTKMFTYNVTFLDWITFGLIIIAGWISFSSFLVNDCGIHWLARIVGVQSIQISYQRLEFTSRALPVVHLRKKNTFS